MATQKDLLRTAILSGAVEGMSMSEGVIDVAVPTEIPERGFSVPSPITGYCAIRVITTKGANQGGTPWFSLEHLRGTENLNGSWFATGGVATITPVTKGHEVRVFCMDITIDSLRFIKVIGVVYSRYLPALSCNRFGGALWLRLKTTSETLSRLAAGLRSRLSVASSSRASHLHLAREIASTCRQQTVFASFGLRVPVSTLRFANPVAHNLSRQTVLQAGRKLVFLVPVDKSSTMRLGVRSSEGSSTSFILSVASNNARMEVAA